MTQPAIESYAFLSDCQSAALVGKDGSIDWYCPPRFDAPAVFARMLDPDGGAWYLRPLQPARVERSYLGDTLVLRTVFHTAQGSVRVTDALAFAPGARDHEIGMEVPHLLVRRVEGIAGAVEVSMSCAPRLEYALTLPRVSLTPQGALFTGGPTELHLLTDCALTIEQAAATATFTVSAGEAVDFALVYRRFASSSPVHAVDVAAELANCLAGWQSWADQHQSYSGPYAAQVRRSALVLQGLTYQPTGAIIAAATTSLPEQDGGELNWDYRYAWLRDLSLTTRALWIAACPTEAERYFRWIAQALGGDPAAGRRVQIMFSVTGECDLTERTLPHLRGYRGSQPVRVGNAAWRQKQLDVLGEVVDAVYQYRDSLDFDQTLREMVIALADQAAAHWREPDAGMWEARDRERHYLSSKVMCWVALDRAIMLAPRLGDSVNLSTWQQARTDVRREILARGWNEQVGAYTGAFDSDQLDASVLLMPLVDFLPASDTRMRATIETIARELAPDEVVHRWKGDANGFLLCSFWLVECLARAGERPRAQALFEHTCGFANDLGLFTEMVDPTTGACWGNLPQTFSHVGLINAAWSLADDQA
ncbi:MAG: glycoside hydrolase family 15 protein [Roseiflexaceae bacterium]|nr:glycoside hydrolase family 15 protein [Roseiflexaceae bacterium]